MILTSRRPLSLSGRKGKARPPIPEPPPTQRDQHVGIVLGELELGQRLLTDDRLVQQYVAGDAAQGIAGARILQGHLDRLADGQPDAAQRVRILGQSGPADRGVGGRRAVHRGAEHLHHGLPVRLLVVGSADPPHVTVDVELAAGEGQRGSPLARSGLGREPSDALLGVVVHLRHRGVDLVGSGRAQPLVLVVDPGRRAEVGLQRPSPVERAGPVAAVDVADRFRVSRSPAGWPRPASAAPSASTTSSPAVTRAAASADPGAAAAAAGGRRARCTNGWGWRPRTACT